MSEALTFANYSIETHGPDGIYAIGAAPGQVGTVPALAKAFGHEISPQPTANNLSGLIAKVGSAMQLQQNIPRVQEVLGTDKDAVALARSWVEDSGLLVPVDRMFNTNEQTAGGTDIAVMTDGVVNWMNRRAVRAVELAVKGGIQTLIMVGGTLAVRAATGEMMTAAQYQRRILKPRVEAWGIQVEVVEVDSGDGEVLAAAAADKIAVLAGEDEPDITVVGNAGNWVQNAGTILRAMQAKDIAPDVRVVCDPMPNGDTSQQPLTHQNPFSALGQVARNAHELVQHTV